MNVGSFGAIALLARWTSSACLLVLMAGPLNAADVRIDSYKNPKSEEHRIMGRLYLDGVRAGLLSYYGWLRSVGEQPAFCPPNDIPTEEMEDIMLKYAEKTSAKSDMFVSVLLLLGLKERFPCENNSR